LKDVKFCESAVKKCIKTFKILNIIVNNAAVQFPAQELEKITTIQLQTTFETNIYPYFFITKFALPHLQEGDCIINTSSVTAYRGSEHLVDYSSTKGAIVSFTRSLSATLAERKIRVNGVAPGPIWTPLIPASFDKNHVASFGLDTPMGRAGQPSEVGPAYVYLASEDSSYVTGQFIHVNGGEMVGG
jgi:NAD(P)-dependent dehydrogenase (short-subunit alcohol dehydrogenase family)